MKMYRLQARGCTSNFVIKYYFATNYMDYHDFGFTGSEQEKYNKFLRELQNNMAPQPIYVDVKFTASCIDRALSRKEVFNIKNVHDFVKILCTFVWHKNK